MKALRRFFRQLSSWPKAREYEERLRAEMEDHLARQTEENIRGGMTPKEARRQAVLKFGGLESTREAYRDQRTVPVFETIIRDTRHAFRRFRQAPAFTGTVILTLALGIGATTSIFTLAYAVLLKSLAVANPDELYRIGKESRCCYWGGYSQNKEFSLVSYELYRHFRDTNKSFAELAAFSAINPLFGVRRSGTKEPAQSFPGEFVSGNYFRMFGVGAFAGRTLTPGDDRPGAPPVAVMSYRLWQQRYGSDPSIIGSVFRLNERPFTVVGISRAGFFGDTLRNNPPDFFLPLNTEPFVEGDTDLYTANNNWLDVIGRIRPGVNPVSVEAELRVELKQWLRSHWGAMSANERASLPSQTLFLRPGGAGISSMREEYEHWLQILLMISGFVLVIVCANVANLMLVRSLERRQEVSLSMALGAPARRVVTQILTESVLLAFIGGAAGLLTAFAGTRLILRFAFPQVAGLAGVPIDASPSIPVLLFAFGAALLTGIGFGLAPGWISIRVDPIDALRGSSRATVRTGSLPRKMLIILQAALSLVLLAASGLLALTLHKLENQDFGFEQNRRMIANIDVSLAGYHSNQFAVLYRRIQDSVSSIPGVSAVALCNYSPLNGNNWGGGVRVDGHPPPGPGEDNFASWDRVTAGYFDVIGTPILRGRGIQELDTARSRHVAVINEAFARKYFKNEDPIGKHFGQHGEGSEREYEVVGVTKDARYLNFQLDKPVGISFFLPESQHDFLPKKPSKEANPGSHFMHDVVIVTRPGAIVSVAEIRKAISSVDPYLPVISIHTLKEQVEGTFRQQRLLARLASFFGLLSLVLCCIGIYGVTAYTAESRVTEIGVRMALGASRSDTVGLVLGGALGLIALGLVIGMPLTLAAGHFLGTQLYGVNPYDPAVIGGAVGVLGACGVVASLIPAWRASWISPMEALRSE